MNFKTAFHTVSDALKGIEDLPDPVHDVINPESVNESRHLCVYWSPSYAGSMPDQTVEFQPADLRAAHDDLSRARITAMVTVRKKAGDGSFSDLLLDKFQAIQDAVKALTATAPDFLCWVSGVAPFYSPDFKYAYVRVEITVGAFQD